MNNNKPVELSEKIDYLFEKITRVHSEIRKNDDIELRLNFEQFIDTCIRSIITIKDVSSPIKNKSKQKKKEENKELYSVQTEKLDFEKKIVKMQMKELENKQLQVQYETLRLKLVNKQKQLEEVRHEKSEVRRQNLRQIQRYNERCKLLEQEVQKLVKLNRAQEEEIKNVKQDRKRAQLKYLQLQQKFNEYLAKLEKFEQKKPRYIDRNTEGLRCTRYYTNTSTGNSRKLFSLKIPATLQVNKLVYGIMIGVQLNSNSKQVVYYDKFQLYEKQLTHIELENEHLVVTYKKRKENDRVILDKYKIRNPEIIVMLFGKGDSVMVHDEPTNDK